MVALSYATPPTWNCGENQDEGSEEMNAALVITLDRGFKSGFLE